MPPRAFDLKQVGKLFDEALASIRDNPLDNETLEPAALAWLKTARYTMMRAIEKSYYDLARSVDNPAFRPSWVDPAVPLYISIAAVPIMLKPYERLLMDNLMGLLRACGFASCQALPGFGLGVNILVQFPAGPAPPGPPPQALVLPASLHVDDEFSRMAAGARVGRDTGFAAGDFGRLLVGVRGGGKTPAAGKKRRASRAVKDESDDERPRLRSITRASSSATSRTLRSRSSTAIVRTSGRKRVKVEE
ncbi:hypothetical protein B0H15DRAFT_947758 [Mycena belliarum]|uniref:Uncharacterized protein n=1 Tax=Mycena belliarum TaxID=1033014 RepID=A0AAD6U9N9_9AGAR|nr:hypothetical protein B0H15DRAFT_947758 [Mycena belliae]